MLERSFDSNAVIVERGSHVVLASVNTLACCIPAAISDAFGQAPWQKIKCISRFDSGVMHTQVSKSWTLSQLVHHVFGLDEHTCRNSFLHSDTVSSKDCPCVGAMFDLPTKWTLLIASRQVLDLHAGDEDAGLSPTVPFSVAPASAGRLTIPVGLEAHAIFRSSFFLQALGISETHLALGEDCIDCQFVSDQPCTLFTLPIRKRELQRDGLVELPLLAKRPRNQSILVSEPVHKGSLLPPFPANQPWVIVKTSTEVVCARVEVQPFHSSRVDFRDLMTGSSPPSFAAPSLCTLLCVRARINRSPISDCSCTLGTLMNQHRHAPVLYPSFIPPCRHA